MKAMNDFVIVEQEVQSHGIITMKENNVCRVISCVCDEELIGKTIIFSTAKTIQEYDGYRFVPYAQVMAVME